MESYRILYRLRVQHDYFEGRPCTAIGCRLTPQGIELARQRNLLFRQRQQTNGLCFTTVTVRNSTGTMKY